MNIADFATLGIAIDARQASQGAQELDKLTASAGRAEGATQKLTATQKAFGTSTTGAFNPVRQAATAAKDLAAAQTTLTGATQRMTIAQQLAGRAMEGHGAAAQALRPAVVGVVGALTPLMGLLGPIAIVTGLAAAAWLEGQKSAIAYEKAVAVLGRTSGLSAVQLRGLAVAGAETAGISVAAARDQATAYVQTGRIGGEVIGKLIAMSKDYQVAFGVDAKTATQQLAKAMIDPDKTGRELTRTMGLLTQAQLNQIDASMKAGDQLGAQTILTDALQKATEGQAAQVDELTNAWDWLGRTVSDVLTKIGEAAYQTRQERLSAMDERLSVFAPNGPQANSPGWVRNLQTERDRLAFDQLRETWTANNRSLQAQRNQREQLVRDQAGRPTGERTSRAAGISDAEREYQSLIRASEAMVASLEKEARTYGMAWEELARYTAAQQVRSLAADGWTQQETALAHAIMDATEAMIARRKFMDGETLKNEANRSLSPAVDLISNDRIITPLEQSASLLRELDDLALDLGDSLSMSFGKAGQALGDVISSFTGYQSQVADLFERVENGELSREKAFRKQSMLEVRAYGDMASAAKDFFDEKSAGYKLIQGAEQAFRIVEFALAAQSIFMKGAEATATVAAEGTMTAATLAGTAVRTPAKAAEGIAGIFAALGPFGFPVAAAAIAVMVAAGVSAFGGGGGAGAAPVRPVTNTGTGTVLGEEGAQSQSLAKSLDFAERYQNRDLDLSNKMVDSLRAIENDIGAVATSIARQLGISGALDASKLGLGSSTSGGFLGIGSTTRTAELAGRGLDLNGGRLADMLEGVTGSLYTLVQNSKTKSGFLGLGGGTTTWLTENRTAIDGQLSQELGRLLGSLRTGVLTAAGQLGIEGAEATLDALTISLGRIDFEGLSSAEISERLNAVFSAAGDQMAASILPELGAYQKAGEGMMETLTRLATTFRAVDTTLASIGMTFGAVGLSSLEARNRLVELTGGLDEFNDQASFFAEAFLTDAQRIAPIQAAVTAELTRLGLASDITRTGFADLVLGLDVSTEAGAAMFAALMRLAPALDQVISYQDELTGTVTNAADLARQRRSLEIALMEAQGDAAGALAARRADELAAMDASLRPLQELVWVTQEAAEAARIAAQQTAEREALLASYRAQAEVDAMKLVEAARSALTSAYEREATALQGTIDKFRGFADGLRKFRESLGLEGLSPGASMAVSKADFERTSALARLGNEEALGELQGVSEAYLEQSKAYSKNSLDHLRNLGAVREAVQAAEATAGRQASLGEQQLSALNGSVAGLMVLNGSVLSVRDAIAQLASAQTVVDMVTPGVANPNREWGVYSDANRQLARQTGFEGDFGAGGFDAWIRNQPESVKATARAILAAQGQAFRIGFSTGGEFTVGGSGGVDSTPISFMATPGEMVNIRRPGDVGSDQAEMKALREELADLKRAMLQVVVNTGMTARATKNTDDTLDSIARGDQPISTVAA